MKSFRYLVCTAVISVPLLSASVALLAARTLPVQTQETPPAHPPVSPDGNYSATNATGNYQSALDAALARAHEALSHKGGQAISDLMFDWQVHSVTGTYGGITGKREVTVTIHVP